MGAKRKINWGVISGASVAVATAVAPMITDIFPPMLLRIIFFFSIFVLIVSAIMMIRGWMMPSDDKSDEGSFSLTIGNMFGGQAAQTINNYEDKSPRRLMRDLFDKFDPRISRATGLQRIRIEPNDFAVLQGLIHQAGESSPVAVKQIVGSKTGEALNNGSLGPTYACDQLVVELEFREALNDQ